jgi:hypothetical protein
LGNRKFESTSLQRGVCCEPDFRGAHPGLETVVRRLDPPANLPADRRFESRSLQRRVGASAEPGADGDWDNLTHLMKVGRERADTWLQKNFGRFGEASTVDIREEYSDCRVRHAGSSLKWTGAITSAITGVHPLNTFSVFPPRIQLRTSLEGRARHSNAPARRQGADTNGRQQCSGHEARQCDGCPNENRSAGAKAAVTDPFCYSGTAGIEINALRQPPSSTHFHSEYPTTHRVLRVRFLSLSSILPERLNRASLRQGFYPRSASRYNIAPTQRTPIVIAVGNKSGALSVGSLWTKPAGTSS